ncbi:hypothetical protein Tco_0640448 [Tanacetum coccineum]
MIDLVNQRKKHFAEERARAKRNKPMTQSQLRTYMMNYLKNQGTWKLSQLKNLSFEEVKEEFDKLVKQVESFAPINFEATKDSLKRFDDSEDSDEASEQDDSTSGTKIPINPVPVAMKSPSIATYKITKQGERGVYQIIREDGTDIVYINFRAMMKDISRDDLTELYRIIMNRYGMNGPEDELENVLWGYLRNMFEEPLRIDHIWSLLGQQRIISWRYYDTCTVHCLNLESMDIYMLIERQYPLSAEVCKAMLDKKLQGGKPDEDCYKLLKWMEKQAGIRKVHCLNLESSDIYMLTERKYPLTAKVCKAMLDKKLQGGKPDEDCYKLLKMMEKQAGIRKHKDWLVQEQTALGKDFSNPLMADNLPKIVWLSTHHIWLVKSWLAHKFMDCGKGCGKTITSP